MHPLKGPNRLARKLADSRIEATSLREEIKRLRAGLEKIVQGGYAEGADRAHPAIAVARDTLDPHWRERAAAHYPKP